MSVPASRARSAAARFAAPKQGYDPVVARQRAFAAWCEEYGLSPFPAHPNTVGLYLTSRADAWALGTLKAARNAIGRQHRAAGLADPTRDPLVQRLWRAIARSKRNAPGDLVDPLTAPLLAEICSDAASDRGPGDEAMALRTEIAAIMGRCYEVSPSRLVRVGRPGVALEGSRARIEVPGPHDRSGRQRPSTVVVVDDAVDPWGLVARLRRYLDLIPCDEDAGPFCVKRSRADGRAFSEESTAASNLASQLRDAGRRAHLACSGAPVRWLGALDDGAFAALLAHSDKYRWIDLRNTTMVAVSFALALRPCEARSLGRRGVRPAEQGYLVAVLRAKQRGAPVVLDKTLHHWPGCPPHCPACLLGAWLDEVGTSLTAGVLFPSKIRAGVGKEMTDGNHKHVIRTMVERSGVRARISPKSARSGLATSMAEAGAETEEITEVSDHVTHDVVRIHYVLTDKGATHRLGRGPRGRSA